MWFVARIFFCTHLQNGTVFHSPCLQVLLLGFRFPIVPIVYVHGAEFVFSYYGKARLVPKLLACHLPEKLALFWKIPDFYVIEVSLKGFYSLLRN